MLCINLNTFKAKLTVMYLSVTRVKYMDLYDRKFLHQHIRGLSHSLCEVKFDWIRVRWFVDWHAPAKAVPPATSFAFKNKFFYRLL